VSPIRARTIRLSRLATTITTYILHPIGACVGAARPNSPVKKNTFVIVIT
jgi:hypothetical protein